MHPYVSYHLISSDLRVSFYCALLECTPGRFSQEVGGMLSLIVTLPSSIFTGKWEFGFWKTWRECSLSQNHQKPKSPLGPISGNSYHCTKITIVLSLNTVILCPARKCICPGISGLKNLRLKNLKDMCPSAKYREHPNTSERGSERKRSSILSEPYRNSWTGRPFSGITEFSISK